MNFLFLYIQNNLIYKKVMLIIYFLDNSIRNFYRIPISSIFFFNSLSIIIKNYCSFYVVNNVFLFYYCKYTDMWWNEKFLILEYTKIKRNQIQIQLHQIDQIMISQILIK